MKFFASWWERIPVREAAPMLLAVIALAGWAGCAADLIKALFSPLGFAWG
jgi:hypothetical protein